MTRHSVVIEPALTASYKGFTANLWGNLDTKPYAAGKRGLFIQLYGNGCHSFLFAEIRYGPDGRRVYLLRPFGNDPGRNGSARFTGNICYLGPGYNALAPTLTVYKEIDHYHQWYATLGVSHTFALHENIGLKLAAQVSYLKSEDETTYPEFDSNSVATTDKFNNLHDGVVSVSLPVNVIKNLTVTPTMTYVFPLSSDAKYEMRGRGLQGATPSDRDSSYLYGGVVLSFAF